MRLNGAVEDFGHFQSLNVVVVPGRALSGTIAQEGHNFDVVVVDGKTYVRGPFAVEHFGSVALARRLGGQLGGVWLLLEAPREFGTFPRFANLAEVVSGLSNVSLSKETGKTVAGRPAVALVSLEHGTLYVASTGTPLPLQAVRDRGEGTRKVSLSFEDWNKPMHIVAPSGAVTLAELAKR